jgi:membrane protease YdiL (CAAX protease family)
MPTVATLLIALAGPPIFGIIAQRMLGKSPGVTAQIIADLGLWAFLVMILYVVTRVERRPLASIGLKRPTWSTIVSGLMLAFVVLFLWPPIAHWLGNVLRLPSYERGVSQLRGLPVWALLFIALTGGIVEETLYRGYAIERLASLTGRYWLAGSIAALAFGLAHVPGWGAYAVVDFVFGIMATLFYLWKRDLLANIIAHVAGLAVGLLQLAPAPPR